jgi:hypothetical protein
MIGRGAVPIVNPGVGIHPVMTAEGVERSMK